MLHTQQGHLITTNRALHSKWQCHYTVHGCIIGLPESVIKMMLNWLCLRQMYRFPCVCLSLRLLRACVCTVHGF